MFYKFAATALTALAVALPAHAQNFDDPVEFAKQKDMLAATANGAAETPWLQYYGDVMADTSAFKKDGPHTICFSNAGVNNPWRVVGWNTMQAEVDLHDNIANFVVTDAEGSDDKQIADIEDLLAGGTCDALIVSPNTTAALTPAVEKACEQLPVIVFDRGVNTNCPVTFIKPVGGYGFGIQSGEFIAANAPAGSDVLMLRILPGVDVLETRYSAAKRILEEAGLNIVGAEFTDGDRAKTKAIVEDYIQRGNQLGAVWMDAGATSVAAIEAFEDMGLDVPIVTGEDQQDFLQKWQEIGMNTIAPTYPTYQWRTPILAALKILDGEAIPGPEWNLPQPAITNDNLADFVNPSMPPLHYAACGCENMPDYPARWGGK
ncbi:substrate-binding domain-containing protein [Aliiroseovarius sp. Z3]|uniref:substrate-binding domain-containing protein n=1 Tax=Aliiroseovarius sp. Z3 TaxID=2811402 RepID=UPI0023B34FFA|nr:substrate-binding domain-containing protein [Aliiroseovarius sp. Z3]MDE9451680.1 substrate-binding domain-containing protein [Aliiroseovarius sp. Z3]